MFFRRCGTLLVVLLFFVAVRRQTKDDVAFGICCRCVVLVSRSVLLSCVEINPVVVVVVMDHTLSWASLVRYYCLLRLSGLVNN